MREEPDGIDRRLRDAILRSRRQEKLGRDAAAIEQRIEEHADRVAQLRATHADEVDDVEALTSTSLRKLVAIVRGDLDERLSEEEAEAARAATALAHEQDLLAVEEERLSTVRRELDELGTPQRDLEDLRDRKREQLDPDSDLARELSTIDDEATWTMADVREIEEAIAAGEDGIEALRQAADLLRSAGSWSTWDVVGGGALVTMAKHGRLDDAREAGTAAAAAIARFTDEVEDVRQDVARAPSVDLDGWDLTFDFWFDNIFTDMRIDGEIRSSQRETARVLDDVERLVEELQQLHRLRTEELDDLEHRRRALLDPPVD